MNCSLTGEKTCIHDRCWKEWLEELMEDRYEAFEIIIKCREDGQSWFNIFVDLVTDNCQGTGERDDDGNIEGCTCGMESAGGMTGTLVQCFKWLMPDEEWEDEL